LLIVSDLVILIGYGSIIVRIKGHPVLHLNVLKIHLFIIKFSSSQPNFIFINLLIQHNL